MRCVSSLWIRWCALAVLLSVTASSLGQNAGTWKPISAEELALTDIPDMPGATAVLLDRDSFVDDTKPFQTESYRIKILREEGRKFSDLEIPYVPKSEEVTEIRARVVRPDGTAVEFQGEVFDKVIVRSKHFRYQAKIVALPGVQVGSIIEYSYKMLWRQHAPEILKHPQNYLFTEVFTIQTVHWTIQHELYTKHARFSVHPLPNANLQWALIRPPAGATVQRQGDGTAVLEVRDVPPMEHEEMMPPAAFINSRIHFFYLLGAFSYNSAIASHFWQGIGRREAEGLERFIGQSKQIARVTAQLFSPNDSSDTKLRKIYDRVQQIRYVSYEPEKSKKEIKREKLKDNNDAEDVLNHGYGYGNQINDLFVAMARAAGFQAFVVRVADRSRQILDTAIPDGDQFSASVVNVHLAGEDRFFDPATRFCPFELIPWAENGVKGLRLLASGGDFISVPGYHSQAAVTRRTVVAKINGDGALESSLHVAFAGQEALSRRLTWYGDDDGSRKRGLEDEIKDWLPATARVEITSITGWDTSQGDLVVDGQVSIPDFATVAGRRLLLPISIFHSSKTNPFRPDTRKTTVYFPYSYRTEDTTTLKFADGLRVASMPPPRTESMVGYTGYVTNLKQSPDKVEVQRTFAMEGFIFDKSQYPDLKQFYERVSTDDGEQIVLQPAEPAK